VLEAGTCIAVWHADLVPPLRPARPRGPFFFRLQRWGQLAACVACIASAAFFIVISAFAAHDRGEPKIWGTFTEERRESAGRRGADVIIGRWISADAHVTLDDVVLTGSSGPDGHAYAYAQPTAYLGPNETVNDGQSEWVGYVLPPVFAVLSIAFLALLLWAWGDLAAVASWLRGLRRT
jgi:hypothetical protein